MQSHERPNEAIELKIPLPFTYTKRKTRAVPDAFELEYRPRAAVAMQIHTHMYVLCASLLQYVYFRLLASEVYFINITVISLLLRQNTCKDSTSVPLLHDSCRK